MIDTATNKVAATITLGSDSNATGVAVTPTAARSTLQIESGDVSVIDTTTNTVDRIDRRRQRTRGIGIFIRPAPRNARARLYVTQEDFSGGVVSEYYATTAAPINAKLIAG